MKDPGTKVISFPSPVPSKADYQRVKSSYSIKEIKQLFGLSEKTLRRWTEQGIIQASATSQAPDYVYDFNALTQFRRVRELRAQGHSIRQIEAELQGQLNLFRIETPRLARLLTPFEEALLLHEQGDVKAAEHYLEAISEGDNVAEAYCNLGIINLELAQLGKALDNFTLALKHEPRHVEAHYNLGNLYYDAGELSLALACNKRRIAPRIARTAPLDFTANARPSPPSLSQATGSRIRRFVRAIAPRKRDSVASTSKACRPTPSLITGRSFGPPQRQAERPLPQPNRSRS